MLFVVFCLNSFTGLYCFTGLRYRDWCLGVVFVQVGLGVNFSFRMILRSLLILFEVEINVFFGIHFDLVKLALILLRHQVQVFSFHDVFVVVVLNREGLLVEDVISC